MNLPSSSSSSYSSHHNRPQPSGSAGSEQENGTHRLTPQEAALRGASLAFQKQQHQTQERGRTHNLGIGTGGISRQTTGSSVRSQQEFAREEAAEKERERERKALFLSPTSEQGRSQQQQQHLLLPPLSEPKSASFIAATLAASRSASPGTVGTEAVVVRRSPMREPVGGLRRGSAASGSLEELTDTTSLAPATSLISLFEKQRGADDFVKGSPSRPARRKPKSRSPRPEMIAETMDDGQLGWGRFEPSLKPRPGLAGGDDLDVPSVKSHLKPNPSPKPKVDTKPKVTKTSSNPPPAWRSRLVSPDAEIGLEQEGIVKDREIADVKSPSRPIPKPKPRVVTTAETPSSPVIRRADTEIVSPKPRRPRLEPRLEDTLPSNELNENSATTVEKEAKTKPQVSVQKTAKMSPNSITQADQGEHQATRRPSIKPKSPVISVKSRPPVPRTSRGLSERLPPERRRQRERRQSVISSHDGQEESRPRTGQAATDARPATSDSKSSNDSFVSASSVLSRDDKDSLPPIEAPSSRSITPKGRASRPASTQPSTPLSMRQSATGSSQLPLGSLSDAIMAGSLASARHTPTSLHDTSTPPPLPPSRRKGGTSTTKRKPSSRRPSPHRMKHTLRQPKPLSDDEEARRPHHKRGLNRKKHAHHEGSRHRWREEITEREKKRYEAVWASNRGKLLVAAPQSYSDPDRDPASRPRPRLPLRNESHEEQSEHVANVIVRDIWSRSRLPEPELAEVWDLVYGHGRAAGRVLLLHGALNKQEFVVGMWLIDQRLRGRKIPPRVSESVWDSAMGVRVRKPDHNSLHGHGHGHVYKGKGKAR